MPKIPLADQILKDGGHLCDVGCGKGVSTLLMAHEYEAATFVGFDIHSPSIREANDEAQKCGLVDRLSYQVADAESYTGDYDIITFFDCLHDMGDPLGAARYAKSHLSPDGWAILIEPNADDNESNNMNTIGQMYYSFSTMGCVPTSKSQKLGQALGAQAGPKKLIEIMEQAGFNDCAVVFRNATNMVIACRV